MTIRNSILATSYGIMAAVAASAGAATFVAPAAAQDCWVDVTVHEGCQSGDWHHLQFRNTCGGGERTVNVCVKWTSGPSTGNVNRYANSAGPGQVAVITPGMCSQGDLQYRWRHDGSVPSCP